MIVEALVSFFLLVGSFFCSSGPSASRACRTS